MGDIAAPSPSPAPSFGQWLSLRRKRLGLTQEELAERLACSGSMIRKVEAGQRVASEEMAELVAELLSIAAPERAAFVQFARGQLSGDVARRKLWQTLQSDTLRPHPTNLPAPLTVLIGRERELRSLRSSLLSSSHRLLTITGPPGIGKTRLGIEAGRELLDQFEDGVFFVSLASINNPDLVAASIAQALEVKGTESQPTEEQLVQFLHNKHVLLVLDNFEQVLDASPLVLKLLGASPRLKVLITSREVLHVYGERQFLVPSLATADLDNLPTLADIENIPAIALFVERARAIRADFALTQENARVVAAICTRLDGLPLAIELAAARAKLLSPQEILSRLESHDAGQELTVLTSSLRNLPARQRTLRNAIEWSYNLLSEGEQTLFVRLGVFVGGFTLSAAHAVCNADVDLPFDVPEGVESLLDKNLLKQEDGEGELYFSMLEVLRTYSVERLQRSGTLPVLRERHARYYLSLAQEAASQLDGEQQLLWLKRLDLAYENVRAAIAWSISHEPGAATALRFMSALSSYWLRRGYFTDARNLIGLALARASAVRSVEKARALYMAGRFASLQGDQATVQSVWNESLDIYRELGDRQGTSMVLRRIGGEYLKDKSGDPTPARRALEEAVEIARESGNLREIGEALGFLAHFISEVGDRAEARVVYEESLIFARQAEDKGLIGSVLLGLGDLVRLDGDLARARSMFEDCISLFEASGAKMGSAHALANLAQVCLKKGDSVAAARYLVESATIFQQMGLKGGLLTCVASFGGLRLVEGDLPGAITFLSATQAELDRKEGLILEKADQAQFEEDLARARALASEDVWSEAWAKGQGMTLLQAAEVAFEGFENARPIPTLRGV